MEGSKGEEAFDALGLHPQLFLNVILNTVDDVVDAAFDFYHQEAVKILGSGGDECSMMSENLVRGISNLRLLVEAALDKLSIWEKYCLTHCFSVPETFVLPKNQFSSVNCSIHRDLPDEQLDFQLNTLRMQLAAAGKKNAELQRDIHSLEMQNRYGASVMEMVQLLEQNSVPQIFEDIEEAASILQNQIQETMASIKDDAENLGLIKINMLKEGIRKEDKGMPSCSSGMTSLSMALHWQFLVLCRRQESGIPQCTSSFCSWHHFLPPVLVRHSLQQYCNGLRCYYCNCPAVLPGRTSLTPPSNVAKNFIS